MVHSPARALAVLAVAMSAAATAAFGAETCLRPQERLAIEVQALKIELSVAALSCDASEDYNAFVRHFRAPLDRHSRTMKAYFARAYGAPAASRETLQNGQWVPAPVTAATVQRLEEIILTRARDLRRNAVDFGGRPRMVLEFVDRGVPG